MLSVRSKKNQREQGVNQIQEEKAMKKVETLIFLTIRLCTRRKCTSCKLLTSFFGKQSMSHKLNFKVERLLDQML